MLDELIAYLRATLQASAAAQPPGPEEFARLRDYSGPDEAPHVKRACKSSSTCRRLAAQPVPPLLLQPLVENAIQHGLRPHVEGGRLRVSDLARGQLLHLSVFRTAASAWPPRRPDPARWSRHRFWPSRCASACSTAQPHAQFELFDLLPPHGCRPPSNCPRHDPATHRRRRTLLAEALKAELRRAV